MSDDVARSIAWRPDALGGTGAVRVRWLGTAGFAIEHDGHVVLIDPYVTRASLARCAFKKLAPDGMRVIAHTPRADAVIVGHTHFDHALDVPAIAVHTGAKVFGSKSAASLCLAQGVPEERVEVVETGHPVEREVGPFRLRFVPSAHSRFAMGKVPFPGEIADCDDVPLRIGAYKCGAVFGVEIRVAGKTLYHMGSAEILEADLAVRGGADLLMLCVAGWTSSKDLPERAVRALAPRAVLLSHWDDFFRPIDRPARALPAMQMPRLVDRLAHAAKGVNVGTLPILGDVLL